MSRAEDEPLRLLEQRTEERDEERVLLAMAVVRLRELETALRRIEDYPVPAAHHAYAAYHAMQKIAREARERE